MNPPEVVRLITENYRARSKPVTGAILHSMSERILVEGEAVYAPEFLDRMGLSVHAMVTPHGRVVEIVPIEYIAYHAGVSIFQGQRWLNGTFLGCEFLVAGIHNWDSFKTAIIENEPYTEEQYQAGGWLFATWMVRFPAITPDRIVPHSQVSGDSVRGPGKGKLDPGPGFARHKFDKWLSYWLGELRHAA